MSVCTFFGHRECPGAITPFIRIVLEQLIEEEGVRTFYVGNQGQFDRYVRGILRELKKDYPYIIYRVVLAYMLEKSRNMKITPIPYSRRNSQPFPVSLRLPDVMIGC